MVLSIQKTSHTALNCSLTVSKPSRICKLLKSVGLVDKSLNFGKYSTFTLIGTNLLRNADVLIISVSPFGSSAVALFSIPLKLTELQIQNGTKKKI